MNKATLGHLSGAALLLVGLNAGSALADEYDEWLQSAQLGPYQPVEEDWDQILADALEEPPL